MCALQLLCFVSNILLVHFVARTGHVVTRLGVQSSRMSVPTAIVDMQVESAPTHKDVVPAVEHITFELTATALDTMLDGLGKIRDQLTSVSGQ